MLTDTQQFYHTRYMESKELYVIDKLIFLKVESSILRIALEFAATLSIKIKTTRPFYDKRQKTCYSHRCPLFSVKHYL